MSAVLAGRCVIINVASATALSGSPLWAHSVASEGDASAMVTGQTIVVDGGRQFL
jgi:hypothetical protein